VKILRKRLQLDYIKAISGEKFLDIGCGTGVTLDFMEGVDYTGFDMNKSYIEYARKRYKDKKCKFICSAINEENIDNYKESFNVALSFGVIHHLDDNETEKLFNIAYRALKPGGRFIYIEPCIMPKLNPITKWMMDNDRGKFLRKENEYKTITERVFKGNIKYEILKTIFPFPYTFIIGTCYKQ
jgi:SAM-dependent methyltransferase